jgi:hypothetical protein
VKYLLLICVDPSLRPAHERGAIEAWLQRAESVRLDGGPLRSPSTAVTVRIRDGERHLADGPFAETAEFVSGFDIIDCATTDEAIEIAAAHPVARFGSVEVRALDE